MNWIRNLRESLGSGMLVLPFVALISACSLDTSVIVPTTVSASPEFICPCETVSVAWNCPFYDGNHHCDSFNVTSDNPDAGLGVGLHEKGGSRELPVCRDTLFAIDSEYEGRRQTDEASVEVVAERSDLVRDFQLSPNCVGAGIAWQPLRLKERTSKCLSVSSFCNQTGMRVRITEEDGTPHLLAAGECGPGLVGSPRNVTVRPEPMLLLPPGACGPERRTEIGPPITIRVTLRCDRDLVDCPL